MLLVIKKTMHLRHHGSLELNKILLAANPLSNLSSPAPVSVASSFALLAFKIQGFTRTFVSGKKFAHEALEYNLVIPKILASLLNT